MHVRQLTTAKATVRTLNKSDRVSVAGLRPSEYTYGSLLHAAARSSRLDIAKRVFAAIQVRKTDASTAHRLLINKLLVCGRFNMWDVLQDGGVAVNVQTYTSLMDAFLKHGGPQAADMVFRLFDEMRAAGIAPSAVTYGCLLLACRLQRRVDLAFSLYQQACDEVRSATRSYRPWDRILRRSSQVLCSLESVCAHVIRRLLARPSQHSGTAEDKVRHETSLRLKLTHVLACHNCSCTTLSHCFVGRPADGHVP